MSDIYVVRLQNEIPTYSDPTISKLTSLPSEQRYSSSLVLGLGLVHLVLGVLSLFFGIGGLVLEREVNEFGAGIWNGIAFVICGICGILGKKIITKPLISLIDIFH